MDELETAFRDAMARVAAPVTVITTDDGNRPSGTTVSAFASLSVTPPMVMFALDNRGGMIDRLREAGRVGVNILAGDQADVAIKFAGKHLAERFAGIDWHRDHGLPGSTGSWPGYAAKT
ncbi:flavin reductase family protein [Tessaracoccus sp. HDW20]|nr:flavin reductase family protein [Tessaracoccus coleopterorum]